jgi:LysR family transcriptional regulator, pca operon transcriptional activator
MSEVRIRFRHLQCFLAIAQHRSVGAAADSLAITQPALSKTLRELEDALKVRLFNRDRKGMLLTRFGEVFLQHAAASVASLRQGIDSIKLAGGASGLDVSVGTLPTMAASVMPTAVQIFKQEAAATTVRVVTGEHAQLLDLLRLGELDLVVGRLAQPDSMVGLTFEHLYSESLVVVVRKGHPLSKSRRFRLAMITDYPIMLPHSGTTIRHEMERFLHANGISKLGNVVDATSIAFGRSYTRMTDTVWFAARGIVEPDLHAGVLVELPADTQAMQGPVGITLRDDREPNAAAALMLQSVRKAVKRLAQA